MLLDAWRLAFGTLTALPTPSPRVVNRRVAGLAMPIAPIAVVPLGVAVGLVALTGLPMLVKGLIAVAILALGTRAFHLDGLADTVDGLAASHDRERSLAVMKTGDVGPAGAVALILVIGLQAVGFAYVLHGWRGGVLAAIAVMASRVTLASCCIRGVRSARPGGLGDTYTQTVSPAIAALGWVLAAVAIVLVGHGYGLTWWHAALAGCAGPVAVGAVLVHILRRLGGVTGDVFGAAIEISLATILVAVA